MFRGADGILGLAFAPLDDAFRMPDDTWQQKYSSTQVRAGTHENLVPYLIQLASKGIAAEKIAFSTHRSFVHVGVGNQDDPLNQGWIIVGGRSEHRPLHGPLSFR
jgi:hypothetical protein